MQQRQITDDLNLLLDALPTHVYAGLMKLEGLEGLLEIVMDLGRPPEARFQGREVPLDEREITADDLDSVVSRVGEFGDDNRAGIERTLHRISAIRNRNGWLGHTRSYWAIMCSVTER